MRWDYKDGWDSRVVDDDDWRDIGNHDTLQDRCGVYLFASSDLQVRYVGKAGPSRMIMEIGSAIDRGKDHGATLVKALYTNSHPNAKRLEDYLIRKYKPTNNSDSRL